VSAQEQECFESLLRFLQQQRGFDFTGYKPPSVMRRMLRRMHAVGVTGFEAYRDYLEVHPEEFALLFNTILINVTSFFRDPPAWEFVEQQVLPEMLASKGPDAPVRVWSAGCASGQEAYSVAMLFAEALGDVAFRKRVKVYATDADEEALTQARPAAYAPKDMEDVPPRLRERYFEQVNGRYVFRTDLRRSVIFGRHDLVQDAPISHLDLLVCRNTLMYFNAETQAKVMSRFHFALNGHDNGAGYLFLGRAEMLLTQSSLFTPLDLKCRVFAKLQPPGTRQRTPALAIPVSNGNGGAMNRDQRLREMALEEMPLARMIVDTEGTLVQATQKARLLFSLNPKDVGRPLQDLEISYRPTELRSLIELAYGERRPVTQTSVERRFSDAESQYLDITVQPLYDESQAPLGVSVTFVDVTRNQKLLDELQRSREEIQTTNEELQSSNEELETTNEELQSSNEELETTNEELQSTNEELETMNEELQSTNEELETINDELRDRTGELNGVNEFLEAILTSLGLGVAVLDLQSRVQIWNNRAEDLWGLRRDEALDHHFLSLDIGLPSEELAAPLRAVLTGHSEREAREMGAVNRRGRSILCAATVLPLLGASDGDGPVVRGAIVMMEDRPSADGDGDGSGG
jgi:two-component system CheB/CheR fusion protein